MDLKPTHQVKKKLDRDLLPSNRRTDTQWSNEKMTKADVVFSSKTRTGPNLYLVPTGSWGEVQHGCINSAQAASLATAGKASQRKEKSSCDVPYKVSLILKNEMQPKTGNNSEAKRSTFEVDVIKEPKQEILLEVGHSRSSG